jgi:cytoskeletal protein RodZ
MTRKRGECKRRMATEAMVEQKADLLVTNSWEYAERRLARRAWRSPTGLGAVLISVGIMAVLLRIAVVGFPAEFHVILISLGVTAVLLRMAVLGFQEIQQRSTIAFHATPATA